MIWPRLIFLLLLPLGLGGCWERSTRLTSPRTVSYGQDRLPSATGDDLPTPRLFQIQSTTGPSGE
jgi:hypothetical protein